MKTSVASGWGLPSRLAFSIAIPAGACAVDRVGHRSAATLAHFGPRSMSLTRRQAAGRSPECRPGRRDPGPPQLAGRKVGVPPRSRFTFTCMDPADSAHDAPDAPSQLTVTFDDVQGPYRRRLLLGAAAVALTLVVCGAAWRLSTLPGSTSTRQAHRSASHGRRHARRARRVAPARRASAPPAARPRRLTQARSPNRRRAVSTSAIPPNPGPSRLKINSSVGPARPLSRPAVGQGPRQGQFDYLGK